MLLIDYLKTWWEASFATNREASPVVAAFVDRWATCQGISSVLHSNKGAAFESRLLPGGCWELGIRETQTTSYHPETNGLVEQISCAIKNTRLWLTERQNVDPPCMVAYRSPIHISMSFSLAVTTFGRERDALTDRSDDVFCLQGNVNSILICDPHQQQHLRQFVNVIHQHRSAPNNMASLTDRYLPPTVTCYTEYARRQGMSLQRTRKEKQVQAANTPNTV